MGLTSAMNTSLNGLALNEVAIDVLGNNIANAGTNGFKASTALFATQLARTFSVGSRPTATNGGTNPRQIGLGASTAAIFRDFTQGSITNSTSPSDLAIQGDGFFVVGGSQGTLYTRNGNFTLNGENVLVNAQGMRVQGYGVTDDFRLITTSLSDLEIPLGELNVAQQTQNVTIDGTLFAAGELGTQGAQLLSEVLTDSSTAAPATAASLLSNVQNSSGQNLFTVGQTLSFSALEGGRRLEPQTLTISATTALAEVAALMDHVIGIHSGGTIPDDPNAGPGQPGVAIVGGQIQVTGNMGVANDLVIATGDLLMSGVSVPLTWDKTATATGEGTITDLVVYDSLGQEMMVKLSAVLESQDSASTTFRYFVESVDDSDADTVVSSGTITFDNFGRVVDGGTQSFTLDRMIAGAVTPIPITIDFSNLSGISTPEAGSRMVLTGQDGAAPGTLTSFEIDENGFINGVFDNGLVRTLGQVALARFTNPHGLLEAGDTAFREGVNSGPAMLSAPGMFGAGTIRAGAIELSNTDLGRNFVDLIVASTNYRGNARVISSVNDLMDELLLLGR